MAAFTLKYPEQISKIRAMYSDGMSVHKIAEVAGMPYNTATTYIRKLIAEGSIDMRPKVHISLKKHMAEWERVRKEPNLWWSVDPSLIGGHREELASQDVDDTALWWAEHRAEWDAACAMGHKVLVQMAEGKEAAIC